jgi:hypothetical protein
MASIIDRPRKRLSQKQLRNIFVPSDANRLQRPDRRETRARCILNISPGEDRCFFLRCYRNPTIDNTAF